MTVDLALRHINKLCAIKTDGARLIYFRNIIEKEVAAERECCAKIATAELESWNIGGEYYANLTEASSRIASKIRRRP